MNLRLSVLSMDPSAEESWATDLKIALRGVSDVSVERFPKGSANDPGQVVFVDGSSEQALRNLGVNLERFDRRGRAVFLIVREGTPMPQALLDGQVDDVLVHPFRALEVVGKLHHYQRLMMWNEVTVLNASLSELISGLHEDLELATRMQKFKSPTRFPDIKGFRISQRYLAGMRSGGDHFDLAESRDSSQVSMLLSDSSSHGLSSAVLSTLMSVALKLSSDETRSSRDTVQRILEELQVTLSEKDRLSLFYGVVSRKDYRLRYLNLGNSRAFLSSGGALFKELALQGGPITRTEGLQVGSEAEVALSPGDRLVLLSDGFIEAAGGSSPVGRLLDRYRGKEAADSLNELVFAVKSHFTDPDDMPEQDCTGAIFDIDANLIRLAPRV